MQILRSVEGILLPPGVSVNYDTLVVGVVSAVDASALACVLSDVPANSRPKRGVINALMIVTPSKK